MVPDPEAMRILFEVGRKPVRGADSFLKALIIGILSKAIVVRESPLRDGYRVVLQADRAAIVEHGNSVSVVRTGVVGLFAKRHVIRAELPINLLRSDARTRIDFRHLVPESKLAASGAEIRGQNAAIVLQTLGGTHAESGLCMAVPGELSTSQIVVTMSSCSTAIVVAAR